MIFHFTINMNFNKVAAKCMDCVCVCNINVRAIGWQYLFLGMFAHILGHSTTTLQQQQ